MISCLRVLRESMYPYTHFSHWSSPPPPPQLILELSSVSKEVDSLSGFFFFASPYICSRALSLIWFAMMMMMTLLQRPPSAFLLAPAWLPRSLALLLAIAPMNLLLCVVVLLQFLL